MNKDQVAIYLDEHPEFFNEYPELLRKIKEIKEGNDGVEGVIISKKDGFYKTYVGYAKNVRKRILAHNNNKGAKSTRGRNWKLVYKKEFKSKIIENSLLGKSFYFVHSFVCLTKDPSSTIAICDYSGISIPAVVATKNIFGCQFHPEKSSDSGLIFLKNFCNI